MQASSTPVLGAEDTAPAVSAAAVTPSDGSDLTVKPCRALWVGGAGDVKVNMADGTTVTFTAVPAGTMLPIRVTRVYSTGTTATSITAVY